MQTLRRMGQWFLDALVATLIVVLDRITRRQSFRVVMAKANAVHDPAGERLGEVVALEAQAHCEPPELATQLTGAAVDIEVPAHLLWRRSLPPIGVESVPYLDAFVLHHIERISPWRAADVYYQVVSRPVADDPSRFAVEVALVARRLVDDVVGALKQLGAVRLRLVCGGPDTSGLIAIAVGDQQRARQARLRRVVVWSLTGMGLLFVGLVGLQQWQSVARATEIADLDDSIRARKAVLDKAARRAGTDADLDGKLRAMRARRPLAVELVDVLSATLPDQAHLTTLRIEKDRLRISGISRETSGLVPALEQSRRFVDVKFAGATTRMEGGSADRFYLEMRLPESAQEDRR